MKELGQSLMIERLSAPKVHSNKLSHFVYVLWSGIQVFDTPGFFLSYVMDSCDLPED